MTKLLRVRIGSLWLGDLEPGGYQQLNATEIGMLLKNPKAEASPKRFTKETVVERREAAKEKAAAKPAKAAKKTAKPFVPAAKVRAQKELTKKPKPQKRGRPQATSRSERTPKRPGSKRHR